MKKENKVFAEENIIRGSIMQGDPDGNEVFLMGAPKNLPIVAPSSEIDIPTAMASSARRITRDFRPTVASVANPLVNSAFQVAAIAKETMMTVPGAILNSTRIIPLIAGNGSVIVQGTKQPISGRTFGYHLSQMLGNCTWASQVASATVAAGATSASVAIGGGAKPAGVEKILSPVIFVSVSGAALTSHVGARIVVRMTAFNDWGVPLSVDDWIINRLSITKSLSLALIPYARVKDVVTPQSAMTFGTLPGGGAATITVFVDGLTPGETVQVTIPGLDSDELASFMGAWNLNM